MNNLENDYLLALEEITPYEGKWVAVINGKIVCSNISLIETKRDFTKLNINQSPLFDRIPKKEESVTLIF